MQEASFQTLAELIGRTLAIDPATVTPDLTADEVENWDSLNHLRLITAVESRFGLRFSMRQVMEFRNVGDLAAALNVERPH